MRSSRKSVPTHSVRDQTREHRYQLRITIGSALCRAFFARRRGGKTSNGGQAFVAAPVDKEWIGLNRRPDVRLYGN